MDDEGRPDGTSFHDSILALRTRFAGETRRETALPRWLLPLAWCFAIGVWLAVVLMVFAPEPAKQFAQSARDAVARTQMPTRRFAQRTAEYDTSWQEPAPATSLVPPIPRNCDEARAWGLAPAYEGQPGYAPWLDGDHDGISCEPWRGRHRIYLH